MSQIRRTHTLLHSAHDLPQAIGCDDLDSVAEEVEERVFTVTTHDVPPLTVEVTDEDDGILIRVHTRGILIDLPCTLKTFWDTVDELAGIAEDEITGRHPRTPRPSTPSRSSTKSPSSSTPPAKTPSTTSAADGNTSTTHT